jgi:tetratricopeptide (TPR) repeat protein
MSGPFRVAVVLQICALPASPQEAERRAMLEKVGPSVVALRTSEGHGSGLILDDKGTILTSAHVIVSPLPMKVEAQVRDNKTLRTVFFTKVVLIGVHPTHDLAIVRIDPAEHRAQLSPITISKTKVVSRDLVHAVGYPRSRGGTVKVCSSGDVTAVDQFIDLPGYFEVSAEVHPGNSGGPIVDPQGNAVGVVTWGKNKGEPAAWAIPLHDFRPDQFVPLERRNKDPAKASGWLRAAEECLKKARAGKIVGGLLAADYFHLALVEDVSNPDIYYKIGMLLRAFREYDGAAAYLMRSLQIQPWSESRQELYHELGVSLVELRKPTEAVAIWNEGIAKFPVDCGIIWDALAIWHYDEARFLDAACASRASLRAFGTRGQKMNDIYDQCRRRLDADGLSKLTAYEKTIDARVAEQKKTAERGRQEGTRFLTPAAEKVVVTFEGVQKGAVNFDFSTLGKGPNAPKPLNIPDEKLLSLFVRSRIAVAHEHLQGGKIGLAADVLEDVIKTYPDHPDTETARDLLGLIRKKK